MTAPRPVAEPEAVPLAQRLRLSPRRRGIALLLALAVEIGVAILLLFLWPTLTGKPDGDRSIPTTFSINTGESEEAEQSKAEQAKAAQPKRAAAREAERKPVEKPDTPPDPLPEPEVQVPDTFIRMTRRDYAASDLAKARSNAPAAGAERGTEDGEAGAGGGARPGDSEVAGRAPNGEPLYAAEWYRRPTHAELNTYLSQRARSSGWGLIACRTIANYRVEDCQELGEGPRGSGLAGSVRQAAWQFRVRPPRVGGKEQVGAWVSIRIDYTIGKE